MYSGHDDPALINRARDAGAWGWVCKIEEPEEILRAVREGAAGRVLWPRC